MSRSNSSQPGRTFDARYRELQRASSDAFLSNGIPTESRAKLGTFAGVFIPTVLSIWGVLYYLRLGYIVGQAGLLGTLGIWLACHAISVSTTLSMCAIATNGTVKSGGPYYILSRVLGPEFGGSLGVIFILSNILSSALSALAFVESLLDNFGAASGGFLPMGRWWTLLYATILNGASAIVCFVGAESFANASMLLGAILLVSTVSFYFSFTLHAPFQVPEQHLNFTGFDMKTLNNNMWPAFQPDPAGTPVGFTYLFGLIFPICAGVLSAATLSGDLESPSKSIPRGALSAVGFTLVIYLSSTFLLAATVTRQSLLEDLYVVIDANFIPATVTAGLLSTSVFAVLGGIIAGAKVLQALARDELIPGLSLFSYGDPKNDEPHVATAVVTFAVQLLLLCLTDVDVVAPLVTITNLILFAGVNLAVALLKLAGAPNFRPSFRYFSAGTAIFGTVSCIVATIYVDASYGLVALILAATLFVIIAYSAPPKPWGDVTQGLLWHQVRKYLLRLDVRKEHTKFWRPQILLCTDTPLKHINIVKFGNQLKKSGLYVLGHVYKTADFQRDVVSLQDLNLAWLRFVETLQVKAFVELAYASTLRQGIQSLMITAGLGTLKPNTLLLGWPERRNQLDAAAAPTEAFFSATAEEELMKLPQLSTNVSQQEYVAILEDADAASKICLIARNFANMDVRVVENTSKLPKVLRAWSSVASRSFIGTTSGDRPSIHIWPFLITADDAFESSTTLLLLASILSQTELWEGAVLEVFSLVEFEEDGPAEATRMMQLVEGLRIDARVRTVAAWNSPTYQSLSGTRSRGGSLAGSETVAGKDWGFTVSNAKSEGIFTRFAPEDQCRILNDLMREHSSDATIVFTTFHSPPRGTSAEAGSSELFMTALDNLSNLDVPVLMASSPELVVTMSI